MTRPPLPVRAVETGVVAVLRARQATEYGPVVEALLAGGVSSVELTMTTEGVLDELPRLRERFADAAELGVGTVLTTADADRLIDAGAAFIVSPCTDPHLIAAVAAKGVPAIPGGFTPGELWAGWSAGAAAVKLFPASTLGPGFMTQLHGPFPGLPIMPSGGIDLEDVPRWVRAGSAAVSIGGPLVRDAFGGGDLAALSARARRAVDLVAEARSR